MTAEHSCCLSAPLRRLQLAELEAQLAARFPAWVGFCHNDLQYGNMLLFGAGESGAGSGASAASAPAADAPSAPAAPAAGEGTALEARAHCEEWAASIAEQPAAQAPCLKRRRAPGSRAACYRRVRKWRLLICTAERRRPCASAGQAD